MLTHVPDKGKVDGILESSLFVLSSGILSLGLATMVPGLVFCFTQTRKTAVFAAPVIQIF